MSEISKVNLKHMLQMAESISERGYHVSEKFEKFLFYVKTMQEYWQGENYRNFVQNVNRMVRNFVEICEYYTEKLPKEIIEKRNLYARAMNEIQQDARIHSVIALDKIIIKEQGDVIKYKSSAMQIKIDRIINIFDDIKMNLSGIEDDFKSIIWEGSSRILMKKEFDTNIFETQKTIRLTKQALQDNLTTAMRVMEKAEIQNCVLEASPDLSNIKKSVSELNRKTQKSNSTSFDWEKNAY